MAKRKILSDEEIEYCLRAWRECEDESALELLVVSNVGLVGYFAKKHYGQGLTFDELRSAGNEALVRAINKFDYQERGVEGFSSYISVAIDNAMKTDLKKYNKHSQVLSLDAPVGYNKDGDELKLEDLVGTDAEELIENVISEMKIDIVRDALNCLTSRERQIILLRYGLDEAHKKTLEEIAELLNCSKQLVSKQEKKALVKMRHPRNTRKLKDFID